MSWTCYCLVTEIIFEELISAETGSEHKYMASDTGTNWRYGKRLLERIQYMFEAESDPDITFMVGTNENCRETVRAHRFILSCGSHVFQSMFQQWNGGDQPIFTVNDVEPEAFKGVLMYMYTEQTDITAANALILLGAAKKFDLPDLVTECSSFLQHGITPTNVCSLLNSSFTHLDSDLAERCMKCIRNNAEVVLESEEFLELTSEALEKLVRDDQVRCPSEVVVFDACMRWAEAACQKAGKADTFANKRDALGGILYHIRFPQITSACFTRITKISPVFSAEEKLEIYEAIGDRETWSNDASDTRFNKNVRTPSTPDIVINRFNSCDEKITFASGSEYVDFTSNRNILIGGVGLYSGVTQGGHRVQIQLIDDNSKVLADSGLVFETTDRRFSYYIDVLFPVRYFIVAFKKYTLKATINGSETYTGRDGKNVQQSGNISIEFTKSRYDTREGRGAVERGQIPHIIIQTLD